MTRRAAGRALGALALVTVLGCGDGGPPPPPGAPPGEGGAQPPEAAGDTSPGGDAAAPPAPPGAAPAPTEPGATAGAATVVEGTLSLTGTAESPLLVVRADDGRWLLQGGPQDELGRLDGARVRVTGRAGTAGAALRPLEVTAYELVAVDGRTPFVGTVAAGEAGAPVLVTADERLPLSGGGGLGDRVGARVWVLGRRTDAGLAVESYGVIRPAG